MSAFRQTGDLMSASGETIDDGLIARAAAGDRAAQAAIYESYGGRVYQTVWRIVGDNDAADVMQDVFVHLFGKLSSYRRDSAFSTWLHRLVVNEALQHLRRRKQQALKTLPLSRYDLAAKDQAPHSREVLDLLTVALDMIDPELRLVFQLKVIDELSYAQIAEIVGIPEGTVGSRLNRARRELRDQMLNLGWEQ
ncbi:MAG: RNA polymerase sigma factor [Planctomycetales bacterium]|nr:RNA polymerase sigma factor [Planctomycetales bacterium]